MLNLIEKLKTSSFVVGGNRYRKAVHSSAILRVCCCCGELNTLSELDNIGYGLNSPIFAPLLSHYQLDVKVFLASLYIIYPSTTNNLRLCKTCHSSLKSNKIPFFSRANGFDYGEPGPLATLTAVESQRRMISVYIPRIKVVVTKGLKGLASKGHAISFVHEDGLKNVARILPRFYF